MTLDEISKNEETQNEAFKQWVAQDKETFLIGFSGQQDLCDYVAGLNREIADLQSDVVRLTKDKERIDWLADINNTTGCVMLPTDCVKNNLHGGLRASIDCSIELSEDKN